MNTALANYSSRGGIGNHCKAWRLNLNNSRTREVQHSRFLNLAKLASPRLEVEEIKERFRLARRDIGRGQRIFFVARGSFWLRFSPYVGAGEKRCAKPDCRPLFFPGVGLFD